VSHSKAKRIKNNASTELALIPRTMHVIMTKISVLKLIINNYEGKEIKATVVEIRELCSLLANR